MARAACVSLTFHPIFLSTDNKIQMSPSEWYKPTERSVPQLTASRPDSEDELYDSSDTASEERDDAAWSEDSDALSSEASNEFDKMPISTPKKSTVLPITPALFVNGLPFRRHRSQYSMRDVKTTVKDPQSPPPSGVLTVPRAIPLQSRRYSSTHHPIGSPPLTTTHPIRRRTMDTLSTNDPRNLGKLDFSKNGHNDTPLRDTGWVNPGIPVRYRNFPQAMTSEAATYYGPDPPLY